MLKQTQRRAHTQEGHAQRRAHEGLVHAALATAVQRICPVWDVKSFIAANSLQGFESYPFRAAVEAARAFFHADALMPLEFYQEQQRTGRITPADHRAAKVAHRGSAERSGSPAVEVLTLAERIDRARGTRYEPLIAREVSKWCAAYFDQGQATWPMPGRHQRFFTAWRQLARHDSACRWGGIHELPGVVEQLLDEPEQAILTLVDALGVPADDLADYLTRLLTRLPGWSGHVLWRSGQGEEGTGDLSDLVAIGLAYEWALARSLGARADGSAWEAARGLEELDAAVPAREEDLDARLAWQEAYERAYRHELLKKLGRGVPAVAPRRPAAQVVFCIDVRSEVLRRHLEQRGEAGQFQTFGFAGFFGFPIAHQAFGSEHTTARCPALLRPRYTVPECPVGGETEVARAIGKARLAAALKGALAAGKSAATSCYFAVESMGLFFGAGTLLKTLAPRTFARLHTFAMDSLAGTVTRPVLDRPDHSGCHAKAGHESLGIPIEDQAVIARNVLTILGLTSGFGRIVLLCGHGSSSTNNPYAAALDCGACGGHEGGTNARIAAAAFNNPAVCQCLADWGIDIPADTCFLAGRHDTTTDAVEILDERLVPASHAADLAALKEALATAGVAARRERAGRFGSRADAHRRAVDWSEVRPEWGLAGNAAFVVGPRDLSAAANLEGRVFLHSYDHRSDPEGTTLEAILTAPLIVGAWINLQYYFSTVDNRRFGSGDKVLHNVVGKLGVMQGNHSDLQIGLPWQSISDGRRLVHEPLRLTAVVQAPRDRIGDIVARHEALRRLVDNEWITLVALDPADGQAYRYRPGGTWSIEDAEQV